MGQNTTCSTLGGKYFFNTSPVRRSTKVEVSRASSLDRASPTLFSAGELFLSRPTEIGLAKVFWKPTALPRIAGLTKSTMAKNSWVCGASCYV